MRNRSAISAARVYTIGAGRHRPSLKSFDFLGSFCQTGRAVLGSGRPRKAATEIIRFSRFDLPNRPAALTRCQLGLRRLVSFTVMHARAGPGRENARGEKKLAPS